MPEKRCKNPNVNVLECPIPIDRDMPPARMQYTLRDGRNVYVTRQQNCGATVNVAGLIRAWSAGGDTGFFADASDVLSAIHRLGAVPANVDSALRTYTISEGEWLLARVRASDFSEALEATIELSDRGELDGARWVTVADWTGVSQSIFLSRDDDETGASGE